MGTLSVVGSGYFLTAAGWVLLGPGFHGLKVETEGFLRGGSHSPSFLCSLTYSSRSMTFLDGPISSVP